MVIFVRKTHESFFKVKSNPENVQTVTDFITSEQGKNEDLSDKYLTYKLTILLLLTSAYWVLVLQHLDIGFMTKGTNNYIFTFEKFHKE